MYKNYIHTLCWNLPTEVNKAVELLYELNNPNDFVHIIVDLGFPLTEDKVPSNIEHAKNANTKILKSIAKKYNSQYIKFENVGVSQNWSMVYDYFKMDDTDILCCADPDEHPKNKNWIKAIRNVINGNPDYAWVSLIMPEHFNILNKTNTIEQIINGERTWEIIGNTNWAQGGFSGKFLNQIGGVPFLNSHPIYGNIETASLYLMKELDYKWCMLPDYIVDHTDYEKGSNGSSMILREWKNFIIYNIDKYGQVTLEQYLQLKNEGKI